MIHIVESTKSVDAAARDLDAAAKAHGFGVLHVYDLREKLREKGIDFSKECRILEVCNPKQAAAVLGANMKMSLALPCRISVYEDGGKTWIGTLLPTELLSVFPGSEDLQGVAAKVEEAMLLMIAEAR